MSTADLTITDTWAKFADDGEDFILSLNDNDPVQLAFVDTETAPVVTGHTMRPNTKGMNGYERRDNWPPGYAYLKTVVSDQTIKAGLTKFTP